MVFKENWIKCFPKVWVSPAVASLETDKFARSCSMLTALIIAKHKQNACMKSEPRLIGKTFCNEKSINTTKPLTDRLQHEIGYWQKPV